jgi:nucleotide-binding universal stress UspA family protein
MFKTILVPTDGSLLSAKAIATAVDAAKLCGGKIVGLSVAEPFPFPTLYSSTSGVEAATYEETMREHAQAHVNKLAEAAAAAGVSCEVVVTQSFSPSEEILKAAKRYACDAIFMASHGRKGLNKLFLGSETQKVLAHTTLPVLVIRNAQD